MVNHLSSRSEPGLIAQSDCTVSAVSGYTAKTFGAICEQYERRLFFVALRILKNNADAEDAVQESLLRAYTKMDSFRGESGVYTWLVRIVINTSLMMLRKRRVHPSASLDWADDEGQSWADILPAPDVSAEAQVIMSQRQAIMHNAIAALPHAFSGLFSAWIVEERTMAELSTQFKISLPAAKSRVLRARQKVIKTVSRQHKLLS